MRLISLKMRNIRSYTSASVSFPKGIVMLSGDIGSGKSTILLAIEFALFGILRGELSGNALLRHGSQEGDVELAFEVEGLPYAIKRTLKRGRANVEQDAGALFTNGVKTEGTATELKSKILALLGYPPELLTKTKNLVYRYTVYTAQEDMKRILLEDRETRVSILRKVFDIDKYQRIKQNASVYAKSLRERKKEYEGMLSDFEEKKQLFEQTKSELNVVGQQVQVIGPQIVTLRTQLVDAKTKLQHVEQARQNVEALTRELHVHKTQFNAKTQQHAQVLVDLNNVNAQLQQDVAQPPDVSEIAQKMQELQQQLQEKDVLLRQLTTKTAEHATLKKQAVQLSTKINSLENCPTCLQDVTSDHKTHIVKTQEEKISGFDKNIADVGMETQQHTEEKSKISSEIDGLRKQEQEAAVLKVKYSHYQELQTRKTRLDEHAGQLKQDADSYTRKITETEQKVEPLQAVTTQYAELKRTVDTIQEEERQLAIKEATFTQQQASLTQTVTRLEQEIEKKKEAKNKLEKIHGVHHWLTNYFIQLMDVIEQHVMVTIHQEFNALFQEWFSMLMEDDIMTARLDESFTPIVQQNGYDIEVQHLSGGERTACALAYRLALNKTINSLINTIKTKDLLILDEPTDGFSTEQLDRMRDVLEQLQLGQIIIVSHEQKLESFADHILRAQKSEHMSTIEF